MPENKLNPILLDIPSEITTDRLLLRVPRDGDGAIVWPSVRRSLPELKLWLPWATDDYNQQAAEEWSRRSAGEFLVRKQMPFLIFSAQGEHLGTVGVHPHDWNIPSCEIGYWLRTDKTGHGYMTESVGAVMKMLGDQFKPRRVQIRADAQNARSRRVAELAGFQLEGILRNDSVTVGSRLRDTCVYSRIENVPNQELFHP
jgi:ribosomal-protein-serine acetyltransferase